MIEKTKGKTKMNLKIKTYQRNQVLYPNTGKSIFGGIASYPQTENGYQSAGEMTRELKRRWKDKEIYHIEDISNGIKITNSRDGQIQEITLTA